MDRRRFLALSGAAAAGSLLAGPAFAYPDGHSGGRHPHESDVESELAVAAALGKPLLVLVRPPMPTGSDRGAYELLWERETAFGAWLRHGGAATWAHLALAHVTSASLDDLRAVIPDFGLRRGGVPWLVLVETGTIEPRIAAAGWDLPDGPPEPEAESFAYTPNPGQREALERHAEAVVAAHNAALDEWLGELLRPGQLTERARQTLGALSVDERDALEAALAAPADADEALLRGGAAVVLHRAATDGDLPGEALVDALASASSQHLNDTAPRGAHWASTGGCGSSVRCDLPDPDASRTAFGCGMGHVPKISRHFLDLFAEH